jgi:mannose-6-phosphate isomerase-like protein (cupin superfamily)
MKGFILLALLFAASVSKAQAPQSNKYVLERDETVAKTQPGPHDGGGSTIGYSFFDKVSDYKTAFKKRTLKPGSSIGYHLQEQDELFYILEGKGEMKMNGESFPVKAGDAILTRTGSSHGLTPKDGDLTLIIVYAK